MMRKCAVCGNPIDPEQEDAVPFKGDYVHRQCLTNMAVITRQTKAKEDKAKQKQKNASKKEKAEKNAKEAYVVPLSVSEEEYQEKKALLDYLGQLTKQPPTAKVYRLLQDYHNKYGFSFQGMNWTLQYIYGVLEKELKGDGVGLIPYYYNEAFSYMQTQERVREKNSQITEAEFQKMFAPVTVQVTKQPKPIEGLIDISKL